MAGGGTTTDGGSTPGADPSGAEGQVAPGAATGDHVDPLAFLRHPSSLVGSLLEEVSDRVAATVRPGAVIAVVEAFTFPLVLMVAVLLFLVAQSRMDDPKFRMAPLSKADTTIVFQEEART